MRFYIDEFIDNNPLKIEQFIKERLNKTNNKIITELIDEFYLFDDENAIDYYNDLINNYRNNEKLNDIK